MPGVAINVVARDELTASDLSGLRGLSDSEYLENFGGRDPDMPYGYTPHAVHVIAAAEVSDWSVGAVDLRAARGECSAKVALQRTWVEFRFNN